MDSVDFLTPELPSRNSKHSAYILLLPTEIILAVLYFLDVAEILILRQTCTLLSAITRSHSLWLHILRCKQQFLPLPRHLEAIMHGSSSSLSIEDTYDIVFACRTATRFSLPRCSQPGFLTELPYEPGALVGLRILGPTDRWIVAVYTDGVIGIWDIGDGVWDRGSNKSTPRTGLGKRFSSDIAGHFRSECKWTSFEAAFELSSAPNFRTGEEIVDEGCVYIVVNELFGTRSVVYRAKLTSHYASPTTRSQAEFEHVYTIVNPPLASTSFIRAFDVSQRLVVLSYADCVMVVRWPDPALGGFDSTMVLSNQSDSLEEIWNGVILARIASPYVVIFRSRSVEAYPLVFPSAPSPSSTSHCLPTLSHRFLGTTFKDISCADVFSSKLSRRGDQQEQCLRLTFFGSDILQGLFQYTLCIRIPQLPEEVIPGNIPERTSTPPDTPLYPAYLDVECVGVYAMTNNLDVNAIFPLQIQSSNPETETSWSQSPLPSPLPTPTPTFSIIPTANIPNIHANGSDSNGPAMNSFSLRTIGGQAASSRGFVSAFHLGPQGKRAVWVERRRGSLQREVFVWAKEEGAHEVVDRELGRRGHIGLEGKVVFVQGSYDLRMDLVSCALGEVSGRIVTGNRVGALSVLDLE